MSGSPNDPNGGMIDSRKSKHALIGVALIFILVCIYNFLKADPVVVNNAIGSITLITIGVITGHTVLDYFSKKN